MYFAWVSSTQAAASCLHYSDQEHQVCLFLFYNSTWRDVLTQEILNFLDERRTTCIDLCVNMPFMHHGALIVYFRSLIPAELTEHCSWTMTQFCFSSFVSSSVLLLLFCVILLLPCPQSSLCNNVHLFIARPHVTNMHFLF